MDKVRYEKYVKVCERLEQMGKTLDRMSLLMDIESADKVFELRLGAWDKSPRKYIGKLKMERIHRKYA